MSQLEKVVIVDPYSSGALYAPEFAKHGYACFALQSGNVIPAHFAHDLEASNFIAVFQSIERFVSDVKPNSVAAFVAGCDTGVALSDKLAERYGLPGNDFATSDARRLKHAMHEALKEHGVRYIESRRFNDLREFSQGGQIFPEADYIVKPVNSAGSEGVRFARGHAGVSKELAAAAWGEYNALGQINDGFVVQPFIAGVEYAVDLISYRDNYFIASVYRYRKTTMNGSRFVCLAADLLDPHDTSLEPLFSYAKRACRALGVTVGPVHMELMWDAAGPVMIEAGARPAGAGVPTLSAEVYDHNLIEVAARSYLGLPLHGSRTRMRRSGRIVLLASHNDNVFAGLAEHELEQLSRLASYRGHKFYVQPGETLSRTIDLATCPGVIFLAHEDNGVLDKDETALRALFAPHLEARVRLAMDAAGPKIKQNSSAA